MERKTHKCPNCGKETDKIHDDRKQVIKEQRAHSLITSQSFRLDEKSTCRSKRFFQVDPSLQSHIYEVNST